MSLRPRYSLLTLLLLTAIVAGGVKLWYGPQWAELSDPPTQEEMLVIANCWTRSVFIRHYGAKDVRYQFTRGWHKRHWHLLEGRNFQTPLIITANYGLVKGYPERLSQRKGSQPIVYWVAEVAPEARDLYLLAEDQHVYCFDYERKDWLRSIDLTQISAAAVRERLEVEIRQLQETAKAAKLGS